MTEKKLKRKFNKQIKKYQLWCIKYGYNSKDSSTLVWFFNRKKSAVKIEVEYYIVYKDDRYKVSDVIDIFKINKK